jgi:carbon storage regulator
MPERFLKNQGGPHILILTRKPGEKINIGDDMTITVVQIEKGRVRIGVEAPSEVSIWRQEIYDEIMEKRKGKGDA